MPENLTETIERLEALRAEAKQEQLSESLSNEPKKQRLYKRALNDAVPALFEAVRERDALRAKRGKAHERIIDTLTTLDSYLSLHLHRGTTRDEWDAQDKTSVEAAIYEARKLCRELAQEKDES